jgi:hypothetical protein
MNATILYCIKGETEKFIKSFQWYVDNIITAEEEFYELYNDNVKKLYTQSYLYADYMGHIDIIAYLKTLTGYDININISHPLIFYCMDNNLDRIKKYLINNDIYMPKNTDITAEDKTIEILRFCMSIVCYCEYIDIIKFFINYFRQSSIIYDINETYWNNCTENYVDYDNELDDSMHRSDIIIAAENNHFNIVKLLFDEYYTDDKLLCLQYYYKYPGCSTINVHTPYIDILKYACINNNFEWINKIFNLCKNHPKVIETKSTTFLINFSHIINTLTYEKNYKTINIIYSYYVLYNMIDKLYICARYDNDYINMYINLNELMYMVGKLKIKVYFCYSNNVDKVSSCEYNQMLQYITSAGIIPSYHLYQNNKLII